MSSLDLLNTKAQLGGLSGAQYIPRPWYDGLEGLLIVLSLILLLATMLGYMKFRGQVNKQKHLKIRPRIKEEKLCLLGLLLSLITFFVYCTGNSCSSYFKNFIYNLFQFDFYDALFEYHPAFGWLILLPTPFIIGAISWDKTYGNIRRWLEK